MTKTYRIIKCSNCRKPFTLKMDDDRRECPECRNNNKSNEKIV